MLEIPKLDAVDFPPLNCQMRVLAIEHDKANLPIVESCLVNAGCKVEGASTADEAFIILEDLKGDLDVIILDGDQFKDDEISLLRDIKKHTDFSDIPVIVQSASDHKEHMLSCIEAGIFYYLVKPVPQDLLLSLVLAAANNHRFHKKLKERVEGDQNAFLLSSHSEFTFRTIRQAKQLATFLACFYPNPQEVVLGLSELMINAVEHGNLEVGYEGKTRLLREGIWNQEVDKRLQGKRHRHKMVHVDYQRDGKEISVWIRDEGNGFDWKQYMDISSERLSDTHGRGIALARRISFDSLEFLEEGNVVKATVRHHKDPASRRRREAR